MGTSEVQIMNEKIQGYLIEHWDTFEENVFAKKITLGDREIYPLNKVSILFKKTGNIATISMTPLAWMVKENNLEFDHMRTESQYNMILFDKNDCDHVEEIIKQFKNEIIENEL